MKAALKVFVWEASLTPNKAANCNAVSASERPPTILFAALVCILSFSGLAAAAHGLEPIPDKLVVLTFDDSAKSHYTTVRPILKRYGFGATFFITEGFDFPTNKTDYMTWEEIAELDRDGFEIGNHTGNHASITKENVADLEEQTRGDQQAVRRTRNSPHDEFRLSGQLDRARGTSDSQEGRNPFCETRRVARVRISRGTRFRLRAGVRSSAVDPLRWRCASRLDARQFHCSRGTGSPRTHRRAAISRNTRHGPCLGQLVDAEV